MGKFSSFCSKCSGSRWLPKSAGAKALGWQCCAPVLWVQPVQPTLAALEWAGAEPAASVKWPKSQMPFSLWRDGTVCSCIKGAYMGWSKLLNPQSDQFYLTQTKKDFWLAKKKKKKVKPVEGGKFQRKKMTRETRWGQSEMCRQPEEINWKLMEQFINLQSKPVQKSNSFYFSFYKNWHIWVCSLLGITMT